MKKYLPIDITPLLVIIIITFPKPWSTSSPHCNKASKSYFDQSHYTNFTTWTSFTTYLNEQSFNNTEKIFLDILETRELRDLTKYINYFGLYIFIIFLGVGSIITWGIFCSCCCFHCCLFKREQKLTKCGRFNLISTIISFIWMILISIYGFINVSTFFTYYNGSTCSFLNFFEHAVNGDESQSLPRWAGTEELPLIINGWFDTIDNIQAKVNSIFEHHTNKVVVASNTYLANMNKASTDFYKQVQGISGTSFYTQYSIKYKDKRDFTSHIGMIYSEYLIRIVPFVEVLNKWVSTSENISTFAESIKTSWSGVTTNLWQLTKMFKDLKDNIGGNFQKWKEIIEDIWVIVFLVIYIVFIITSVITIAFVLAYKYYQVYWFRYILHSLWNLLLFFISATFIIGAVFGIIGTIVTEIIPVLNYIFSPDYILLNNGSVASEALESCVNGDGDLSKIFGISGGNVDLLQTFYSLSVEMTKIQSVLNNLPIQSSVIMSTINPQLSRFVNDFTWSTQSSDMWNDIKYQIGLLNGLVINFCAGEGINDVFVVSDRSCPSGYGTAWDTEGVSGKNNCYWWHKINWPSYYASCDTTKEIENKFNSIKQFIILNLGTSPPSAGDWISLNKIIDYNTNVWNNNYNDILLNIKVELNDSLGMGKVILEELMPIIGEYDFYEIFNCSFIRNDWIMFFDQFFNYFGRATSTMGYCCIWSSCFAYVGVFFMIKTGYFYDKIARDGLLKSNVDKYNTNEQGIELPETVKTKAKENDINSNNNNNNNNTKYEKESKENESIILTMNRKAKLNENANNEYRTSMNVQEDQEMIKIIRNKDQKNEDNNN